VLVGLSGTGKGTTGDILKKRLPNCVTWSNGNVFRSLTLLAATSCAIDGKVFGVDVLTPENVASWMATLKFGKVTRTETHCLLCFRWVHVSGSGHHLT
jgi:hypothetical protein